MRPIDNLNVADLFEWCREYHKYGNYSVTLLQRFLIAQYQITQGLTWKESKSAEESFAAACIHLICLGEELNLSVWSYLSSDLGIQKSTAFSEKNILICLGDCAQMLVYYLSSNTERGKVRYKKVKIEIAISSIIKMLLSQIPRESRKEAFLETTTIMTEKL